MARIVAIIWSHNIAIRAIIYSHNQSHNNLTKLWLSSLAYSGLIWPELFSYIMAIELWLNMAIELWPEYG